MSDIALVGSADFYSTGATGDFGHLTLLGGDLLVAAIVQTANPLDTVTNYLGGWTELRPAVTWGSGGNRIMSLWARTSAIDGDQEVGVADVAYVGAPDEYAVGVCLAFRGVDTWGEESAAFRAIDDLSSEFETPLFTFTPTNREILVISGGAMYGDLGTWTPQSPIEGGIARGSTQGGIYDSTGAIMWSEKQITLNYDVSPGEGPTGTVDHRHITGLAVPAVGNPTDEKQAFGAVFAGPFRGGDGFLIGSVGF